MSSDPRDRRLEGQMLLSLALSVHLRARIFYVSLGAHTHLPIKMQAPSRLRASADQNAGAIEVNCPHRFAHRGGLPANAY
jgi:hypothetical protein